LTTETGVGVAVTPWNVKPAFAQQVGDAQRRDDVQRLGQLESGQQLNHPLGGRNGVRSGRRLWRGL
jgi:hypothetical protein